MKKKSILLTGLIIVLVAVLGGLLAYLITTGKIKPLAEIAGPSLTLAPNSQTVSVGQTFNVRIVLDTAGLHTSSIDIHHLHYDPAILEVQDSDPTQNGVQIQPGTIFPSYSLNLVDTTIGAIAMTGAVRDGDTTGIIVDNQTLATITFKALAEATTTILHFDATPGNTADTGIFEPVTANDILASAPDGYVTVEGVAQTHLECSGATCVTVDSPGTDLCNSDADCSHKECSGTTCVDVEGGDVVDQCASDADCQPSAGHHHVCSSTERVCTQVSGSGTNECTTDADCPEPPTAAPTEEPTAEPTSEPTPVAGPVATPAKIITPRPTATSTPKTSPTLKPTFSPTPEAGGTITVFGHEMSKTTFIFLMFVLAIAIIIVIYYIWQWRKKKDILNGPPEAGASDDEQI